MCSLATAHLKSSYIPTLSSCMLNSQLRIHGGEDTRDEGVMHLPCLSTFLSFILIAVHLVSFLLTKLFTLLLERSATNRELRLFPSNNLEDEIKLKTEDNYSVREESPPCILRREGGLLFLSKESAVDEGLFIRDECYSNLQHLDEISDKESSFHSPLSVLICHEKDTDLVGDSSHSIKFKDDRDDAEEEEEEEIVIVDEPQCKRRIFELEEDSKIRMEGGPNSSKSSMEVEWRNSTVSRDSDLECLFSSSSSRRSSSNWETDSIFRKYDQEMMFFDRISEQKLAETESFRNILFQPRSISQRIVHKITTQKKMMKKIKEEGRNPYHDLENAYVAQICLAWEALNWNYCNFKQRMNTNSQRSYCTAWIAQQFQQFQILLNRFIENEPCERGRRPELFARMRICYPKLLQVPELQYSEAEEGGVDMVSSKEFFTILEDAIRTFLRFLSADKNNPCQMLKAIVRRKSRSMDSDHLHLLKKANKKKKMRLKDLLKGRRCLKGKWPSLKDEDEDEDEDEMVILMALIDMKIVSRTLRMAEIRQEQLHWCEEKMIKVRVWDGTIERDSSPLFPTSLSPN
ncbi:uncharacterized protein LOC121990392 [Zingiber officinale]|uniref:Ribosomal protein L34Ae n=1 Tax=Zingiber officinale TaxID=94328 RepID=A0A8J5FYV3_ZINOF|nr:uncharacterized protein LOC121990392 [Zingiber officinale]KAG6496441.1 hypothetical protein ZIOFF_044308 [Zingiber officinale]